MLFKNFCKYARSYKYCISANMLQFATISAKKDSPKLLQICYDSPKFLQINYDSPKCIQICYDLPLFLQICYDSPKLLQISYAKMYTNML